MPAPTIARSLSVIATGTIDPTGTTAGRLGVLVVNLNNGATTLPPGLPAGWSTAIVAATTDGGVPTGTFVAHFYKVLTGSEGVTVVANMDAGSRRIGYHELATTATSGAWEVHGAAADATNRTTAVNAISAGTLEATEDALSFTGVAWNSSMPSGTPAPTWTTGWALDFYNTFQGSAAIRTVAPGSYTPTATLANSLTRYMAAAHVLYAHPEDAPPAEVPVDSIPFGFYDETGAFVSATLGFWDGGGVLR